MVFICGWTLKSQTMGKMYLKEAHITIGGAVHVLVGPGEELVG